MNRVICPSCNEGLMKFDENRRVWVCPLCDNEELID